MKDGKGWRVFFWIWWYLSWPLNVLLTVVFWAMNNRSLKETYQDGRRIVRDGKKR